MSQSRLQACPPSRYSGSFILLKSLLLVTLTLAIFAGAASDSWGQSTLSVETLIGDAVSNPQDPRYSDVAEAITRFKNRDVLGARMLLERATEKDSRLPPVDLTLAKLYLVTGNAQAGRASLEATAKNFPRDPEVYLLLADQAFNERRSIEADALYNKGLELVEKLEGNDRRKRKLMIRAHAGRAAVAEIRQLWPEAISDLQAWVDADPSNANAKHRLGRSLFRNGKAKEGYDMLNDAYKTDQSLPNPYLSAALLYSQMDKPDEAEKTFAQAVQQTQDERTLIAYAQWLLQNGQVGKAETILARARSANANSADILVLSGVAAKMAKKLKPAEDYLLAALSESPGNEAILNQLALVLSEQPDDAKRQRALRFAQINQKLYPNSSETNITAAWILYQLQRGRDAENAFRKGLQLGNMTPDSSYLVARMLIDQDKKDAAKSILDSALKSQQGVFVYRTEAEQLAKTL